MPHLSRRSFMKRGGLTVAAAAMATPALPSFLSTTSSEAPEIDGDASGAAAESTAGASSSLSQPLVAQVKNAATGEISIYSGTQEITYQDRDMAARLVQAAGGRP
jgi:hypothetical protein